MYETRPVSSDLSVSARGEPLEIDAVLQAEIDRLWSRERARRPEGLFDGRIFSVSTIEPARIFGHFVDYRQYIAQVLRPELFDRLRVRPLGVSALTSSPEGVVLGLRNLATTQNAGLWELAPSGGLDPACCDDQARVDFKAQILSELREELGLEPDQVDDPVPFCLLEDRHSRVLDIGVALHTSLPGAEILAAHRVKASNEYLQVSVVPPAELSAFLARSGAGLAPESNLLLQFKGLIAANG